MAKKIARAVLLVLVVVATGCGEWEDEGPEHNAGQDCVECHSFKYAGTIYSSATGGSAVADATIVIHDSIHGDITLTSNNAGNFYTGTGSPWESYLATVEKTGALREKNSPQTYGGCNASGCHDSSMRLFIH